MKTYRPKSWSQQAKEMADKQIVYTLESGNPVESLRFLLILIERLLFVIVLQSALEEP